MSAGDNGRRWPMRILAFGMALCVGLSAWCFLLYRALTDKALYQKEALASMPQRSAKLEARIREIAAEAGFDPQIALDCYPAERMEAIAAEGAAWILSLVNGQETDYPDFTAVRETEEGAQTLAKAISADPNFGRSSWAAREQQTAVEDAAQRHLLPLRASALNLVRRFTAPIAGLLSVLMRTLRIAAWILSGLAALAALLLCLLRRGHKIRFAYLGAGLFGGGLGGASLLLPLYLLDIPAAVGEVSADFAAEVQRILSALTGRHALICGLIAAVGLILFAIGRVTGGEGKREA